MVGCGARGQLNGSDSKAPNVCFEVIAPDLAAAEGGGQGVGGGDAVRRTADCEKNC